MFVQNENNRPTGLNDHLNIQRLYTDLRSEEIIIAYQQPHHRINKSQQCLRKAALRV